MISKIREAMIRPTKQSLSLRENQIIQGKITKIYPDNKAEIQIGSHKLVAEVLTSLSVGKNYFFQVQRANHIQLKVLGEQSEHQEKVDLEALLQQLGLKVTKENSAFTRELVQEKIPFNREQLSQASLLLSQASNKTEAFEILKNMIANKLPMTVQVFQSLEANRQTSMSTLLQQVYSELVQLNSPSEQERALMNKLETMITRPVSDAQPAIIQKVVRNMSSSPSFLNALKALGLVDFSVSENRWAQEAASVASTASTNESSNQQPLRQTLSLPNVITSVNGKEAEQISSMLTALIENSEGIQRTANRINTIFHGLQTGSLSQEQMIQVRQMVEKELFPMLPKDSVKMIQQALQQTPTSSQGMATPEQITDTQRMPPESTEGARQGMTIQQTATSQQTPVQQQVLSRVLELFSRGSTFQELAAMDTTGAQEMPENDLTFNQRVLPEQFLNHLHHYMQSIGMNEEYEMKMNLEHPELLKAMATENPSVKSMLLDLVHHQEQGLGDRAQTLINFINGMQMQSITEVNNLLQASFMIPGDKLKLNQDIFMQFEGKKDESGQIDADYCRILFVLDLANMEETMIDMHIQKRIISLTVFNEWEEPLGFSVLRPLLKDELEKIGYQLSVVKWKPLYDQNDPVEFPSTSKEKTDNQGRERYDFLI